MIIKPVITKPGIILLDKAAGITSFKAIDKVKKKLQINKIGHAGTLDPFATGLLVCAVNGATKLLSYAESGKKVYSGSIKFGLSTDTDDITGEVLEKSEVRFTSSEVIAKSKKFIGEIDQVPPKYSAVKINGVRAHKLAREKKDFKIKSRKVKIFNFSIKQIANDEYSFEIECSKGTYIRSIARDLGQALEVPACLKSLRREGSYPFTIARAKGLESLAESDILAWDKLFPKVENLALEESKIKFQKVGNLSALSSIFENLDSSLKQVILTNNSKKPVSFLVKKGVDWKFGFNLCQD